MAQASGAGVRSSSGFAWLHNLRRLRIRYERHAELHLAFLELGCAVVCQRMLGWP